MRYIADLRNFKPDKIYDLKGFGGINKEKEEISFTNYYVKYNNKPFFFNSGEIHFSRLEEFRWEEELIKMKLAGINVISTYLFWNHHEEIEGQFDFAGNKNIRKFIELCKKHDLKVFARIGPFCHGECRNGGLPDWLYNKPLIVRSSDKNYLNYVSRLFKAYAKEFKGLYFKDGGPIIAIQVENEYMHSSAPWEMTLGSTNEWVNAGVEGRKYIDELLKIIKRHGMDVPFYTSTAWGGACVIENTMPLWGGYAYRPWIFYAKSGKHPATTEYVYQNFHKKDFKCTNDFLPSYDPTTRPYLCCEMGGGMFNSYKYRFVLPKKSVDAMSNIKLGSGCNLLGYYMFHGGRNPDSKLGIYLNENQVPKISYDFQAALGEYGQIRESYYRLKSIHYFLNAFGDRLAPLMTYLPKGQEKISPTDSKTLRYAIRNDGKSGFLFINNFQDHHKMKNKSDESVVIKLKNQDIVFNHLSIAKDENAILPFNMDLNGINLISASAMPLTKIKDTFVFFTPDGLDGEFNFSKDVKVERHNKFIYVKQGHKNIKILLLSREEANKAFIFKDKGLIFTNDEIIIKNNEVEFKSKNNNISFYTYPINLFKEKHINKNDFSIYKSNLNSKNIPFSVKSINKEKYLINIDVNKLSENDDVCLSIKYIGDVMNVFLNSKLIEDNFNNGEPFEIYLKGFMKELKHNQLYLSINPIKEGLVINANTAMAGRNEQVKNKLSELTELKLNYIYKYKFKI